MYQRARSQDVASQEWTIFVHEVESAQFKMRRQEGISKQLDLPLRTHGGARRGAGRPPAPAGARRVAHRARPRFDQRKPVHVTLRVAPEVWNLRSQRGYRCVERALAIERAAGAMRVVHYSVQSNHVHLLVEARDAAVLARRMQVFGIRFASAVNAMMGRGRGHVLGDRYHARVLGSPREVHRAIRYVLENHAHHVPARRAAIDPYSSAPVFEPYCAVLSVPAWLPGGRSPPVSPPRSWLLATGWRRVGPLV
jgi:hypothetical protein